MLAVRASRIASSAAPIAACALARSRARVRARASRRRLLARAMREKPREPRTARHDAPPSFASALSDSVRAMSSRRPCRMQLLRSSASRESMASNARISCQARMRRFESSRKRLGTSRRDRVRRSTHAAAPAARFRVRRARCSSANRSPEKFRGLPFFATARCDRPKFRARRRRSDR